MSREQARTLVRALLIVLAVGGVVALVAAGILAGVAAAISAHLPAVDALYTPSSEATRIYAADGQLIASLYQENRDSIPLAQISRTLRRAVIDAEDAEFYHHHGVSLRGVLRAGLRNVQEKGYAEGGSTITQQLARNLFLTSEKSITRKIAEMLLAVQIERLLTKDEILERYLNQVYFGQGAYGVETAAELYFGKPARALTLPESALLAGLIKAPSVYSPYEHLDRARARMTWVLQRMVELGDITPAQMQAAERTPLNLAEKRNGGLIGIRAPYFVSYLLPALLQRYGEDVLYRGGLRVYTTLDLGLQAQADAALKQGITDGLKHNLNAHQGALVVLDPRTGAIRAMVGGYSFRESQFNRAWQSHRQPGSAFKPFVYTVALMRGIPPTKMLLDEPIEFPLPNGTVWKPQDYDKTWHGWVTMRYALENSINVASIRLEQEVGPAAVVSLARRMGIQSALQPNLSLVLGSSDVTLLEMASAYGVFANGGVRAAPLAIEKVTDWHGRVLEEHLPQRQVVLSPEIAYLMTDLLKGVVQRGTGVAANIGIPQAGKTGTADDFRNAWFIGFTPSMVTAVWVGNDDDSPMNHVVGGGLPSQIWAAFMKQATANVAPEDWMRPEGIVEQTVCGKGSGADSGCPNPHPELFIRGTEPESFDPGRVAPAGPPTAPGAPPAPAGPAPTAGPAPPSGQPAVGPTAPPTPAPAVAVQASVPLTVTAPREGSQVSGPFLIQGATRPGATVHIVVQGISGSIRVQGAEVSLQADAAGNFSTQVNPWFKPVGATLRITVTAAVGTDSASVTVSVQEQ